MTKVAICARYSSDNQREASIEDQFRLCREYAKRQGWQLVESYSDQAISGASLLRPGIQTLLADAQSSGSTSISREQEDIAGVYKRMSRCVGHAADLLADDLTPSDRRPAQRRRAVAARRLPAPRLPPLRSTGIAHVVPGGRDPAVGTLDVHDAEFVDMAVEGIGGASHACASLNSEVLDRDLDRVRPPEPGRDARPVADHATLAEPKAKRRFDAIPSGR
jgi:Resolvase, N terminal domain